MRIFDANDANFSTKQKEEIWRLEKRKEEKVKTFILKDAYGMAVVNANSKEEAFEALVQKEKADDCQALTFNKSAEDLIEVNPNQSGVIAYISDNIFFNVSKRFV